MAVKNKEEIIEVIEVKEEPVQTGLPSVEADYVEEDMTGEWYSYTRASLNDFTDGDEYEGKPLLLPVEKVQFDDEQVRYRARLLLIDDEEEEYLQINLNVKQDSNIQTNVHNLSSLYSLIGGIQNLNNPGWTKSTTASKRLT